MSLSFLKALFNRSISEFIPIGVDTKRIREEIYWGESNITGCMMLISLKPILYGIWHSDKVPKDNSSLTIKLEGATLVEIKGSIETNIDCGEVSLAIWKPDTTELLTTSFYKNKIELSAILRQSKKSKFQFNKMEIRHIAAAYFYPRKIYLVVVKSKNYLNIFPMDLHIHHPNRSNYFFSLQPSNSAEQYLREHGRVLVCEISLDKLGMAYSLGKNHGKTNLYGKELPFETIDSEKFSFPVPSFCIGYKEIQIDKNIAFDSHTLFIGKVLLEKEVSPNFLQPHHIHRFHYNYCINKNLLDKSNKLEIA